MPAAAVLAVAAPPWQWRRRRRLPGDKRRRLIGDKRWRRRRRRQLCQSTVYSTALANLQQRRHHRQPCRLPLSSIINSPQPLRLLPATSTSNAIGRPEVQVLESRQPDPTVAIRRHLVLHTWLQRRSGIQYGGDLFFQRATATLSSIIPMPALSTLTPRRPSQRQRQ